MTTQDVRDMLGLPTDHAPKPKSNKKKAKVTEKRPDGITRELFALMGERAPPIPLNQPVNFRPKVARPTQRVKWAWTPFNNDARTDHLTMRHWMKTIEPILGPTENGALPAEDRTQDQQADSQAVHDASGQAPVSQPKYPFAKYNYPAIVPQYTSEQYEAHLKDMTGTWTKRETDYLMETYELYDGKWPVVWDRYEYEPYSDTPPNSQPDAHNQALPPSRSMEELKKRYYTVEAKVMELKIPVAQMNAAEYDSHSILTNWNPEYEAERKKVKAALLERTKEEKREEEFLLSELKRIVTSQEKFSAEIKELRDRLDHNMTDYKGDPDAYTSCKDINDLFQKYVSADKAKRQRLSGIGGSAGSPTNAGGSGPQSAGLQQKRNSLSNPTNGPQQPSPNVRTLSNAEQARLGVSDPSTDPQHPQQKITSGVSMRGDRMVKARTAKSSIQTAKIAAVLVELKVPEVLQMPTLGVCNGFERLVGKINLLLDARKVLEKAESEVKIEEERTGTREQKMEEGQEANAQTSAAAHSSGAPAEAHNGDQSSQVKAEEQDANGEEGAEGEAAEEDEKEEAPAEEVSEESLPTVKATRATANKRSASVLSNGSAGSTRSRNTKRKRGN